MRYEALEIGEPMIDTESVRPRVFIRIMSALVDEVVRERQDKKPNLTP